MTITKGNRKDLIAVERDDGSRASFQFPKKGPIPHDAVHYYVERALGLADGFWGMVAQGEDPEEIGAMAKRAGHASARRAGVPAPHIEQLLQAERVVECFEALLWSGDGDPASLRGLAATACKASFVDCPPLNDDRIAALSAEIAGFAADWTAAQPGHSFAFVWPPA